MQVGVPDVRSWCSHPPKCMQPCPCIGQDVRQSRSMTRLAQNLQSLDMCVQQGANVQPSGDWLGVNQDNGTGPVALVQFLCCLSQQVPDGSPNKEILDGLVE